MTPDALASCFWIRLKLCSLLAWQKIEKGLLIDCVPQINYDGHCNLACLCPHGSYAAESEAKRSTNDAQPIPRHQDRTGVSSTTSNMGNTESSTKVSLAVRTERVNYQAGETVGGGVMCWGALVGRAGLALVALSVALATHHPAVPMTNRSEAMYS